MGRRNDRILDWIENQDPWVLTKKVFWFVAVPLVAFGALIVWVKGL